MPKSAKSAERPARTTERGSARIDFRAYASEHTSGFVGRGWCLDAVAEWLQDPEPRALLIVGEPGAGKTALAGRLLELSERGDPDGRSELREGFLSAVHFCSSRDHRWIDPIAFVKSVSLQLADALPGFARALLEESDRELREVYVAQKITNSSQVVGYVVEELTVGDKSPQRAFTELVGGPLSRLAAGGPDPTVLLMVDAIDESRIGRANDDIAALLAGIGELPPGVRLIVSSRPDRQFERAMDQLGAVVVSLSTGKDSRRRDDVESFLAGRLAPLRERIDPGLGFNGFVELCIQRADGNLLYARQLLAMLERDPIGQLDASCLNDVPAGLDGIYFEYLDRIDRDSKLEWDRLGPLLGALSVALTAPTEEQLRGWLGVSREAMRRDLAAIGPLLDDSPGSPSARQVSLYHRSFADFLLDGDRAAEFWCPPADQHSRIASSYRDRYERQWQKCDSYGLAHLAEHLAAAGEPELLLDLVGVDFLATKAERTGSLRPVLDDLRLGLRAALDLERNSRALGMVLAHVLLKHRVRRLPSETLPLLAGAGEVDRALELAAMLDWAVEVRLQTANLVRHVLQHDPARAATIAATIADPGYRAYAELDVLVHEMATIASEELPAQCTALAESLEASLESNYAGHALLRLARAAGERDATVRGSALTRAETLLLAAEPNLQNGIALGVLGREVAGEEPERAARLFQAAVRAVCAEGENGGNAIWAGEFAAELGGLDLPAAIQLASELPTTTGRAHALIRLVDQTDSPELRSRLREEATVAVREIGSIGKAEAPRWRAYARVWLAVALEGDGALDALPELVSRLDLDRGMRDVLSHRRLDPGRALGLAAMIRDPSQRDLALRDQVELHLDAGAGEAALAVSADVIKRGKRCELMAKAAVILDRTSPASARRVIRELEAELRGGDPTDRFDCASALAQIAPENARRLLDAGIEAAKAMPLTPQDWQAAAKAALATGDRAKALSLLRRSLRDGRLSDEVEWQSEIKHAIRDEQTGRGPHEVGALGDSPDGEATVDPAEVREHLDADSPTWEKLEAMASTAEIVAPNQPEEARALAREILEIARDMERPEEAIGPLCDVAVALIGKANDQEEGLHYMEEAFAILGATSSVDATLPLEDSLEALAKLPRAQLAAALPAFLEAVQSTGDAILREIGQLQRLLSKADGEAGDPDEYLEEIAFAEAIADATLVPDLAR